MQKLSLNEIGQINLNVKNVEEAVCFYRDTLGLPLLFSMENMAFFNCNGIRLMLSVPEDESFNHPGSVIYFKTENLQGTYEQFREEGVAFTSRPHMVADMGQYELWMAFFKDLDGNVLALMSEITK
ncbi:VOC family protein [Pseudalkalibacillus sp. Hm43]|uniref:VOC family protein n=1 Tax=Pseudalkalibacillus sp. Hm43 TaxID=3450742 RepID=UPI003F431B30